MLKVLSLFSGSLASRVATRLVERHPEVGCVQLLYFRSPFASDLDGLRELVKAEWPGTGFRTQSLKKDYRRLVDVVSGGEFSLAASCLNCRVLLYARARRYMDRIGADYVVTGDIPWRHGVSPDALGELTERVGLGGRVLRPLFQNGKATDASDLSDWASLENAPTKPFDWASVLAETASGIGLADQDPMGSCGRCKLTFEGFGERVANLFSEAGFTLNALRLLDFPIYYKVAPDIKIVVARDEEEKRELQTLFLPQDLRVYPATPHGPMTLVRSDWSAKSPIERQETIEIAARITAMHAEQSPAVAVSVYYRFESDDDTLLVNVHPFESLAHVAENERVEIAPPAPATTLTG